MSNKHLKSPPPLAEQLLGIVRESGLILLVGANLFLLLALIGYDPEIPAGPTLAISLRWKTLPVLPAPG